MTVEVLCRRSCCAKIFMILYIFFILKDIYKSNFAELGFGKKYAP